jgi:hypothetical protein
VTVDDGLESQSLPDDIVTEVQLEIPSGRSFAQADLIRDSSTCLARLPPIVSTLSRSFSILWMTGNVDVSPFWARLRKSFSLAGSLGIRSFGAFSATFTPPLTAMVLMESRRDECGFSEQVGEFIQ